MAEIRSPAIQKVSHEVTSSSEQTVLFRLHVNALSQVNVVTATHNKAYTTYSNAEKRRQKLESAAHSCDAKLFWTIILVLN